MNFRKLIHKLLRRRDFRELLRRRPLSEEMGLGYFEPLKVGRFVTSIQGSAFHYSTPRKDLPNAADYSAFEVAIFEGGRWVLPPTDLRFKDLPWAGLFEEGSWTAVAPYVSYADVQAILDSLEQISKTLLEPQGEDFHWAVVGVDKPSESR